MIGQIKSGQYSKNSARAIFIKYCPPHKARGIHDFILATKSSVWIIMCDISPPFSPTYVAVPSIMLFLSNLINNLKCTALRFYV